MMWKRWIPYANHFCTLMKSIWSHYAYFIIQSGDWIDLPMCIKWSTDMYTATNISPNLNRKPQQEKPAIMSHSSTQDEANHQNYAKFTTMEIYGEIIWLLLSNVAITLQYIKPILYNWLYIKLYWLAHSTEYIIMSIIFNGWQNWSQWTDYSCVVKLFLSRTKDHQD